jgi:hypothetical protein
MDQHKLSDILIALGAIVTTGAFLWWAAFYGTIAKEFNASLSDAVSCLYSTGGACGFVSSLTQFIGKTPYTPVVFWIGIGMLASGFVIRSALKDEPTPESDIGDPGTGEKILEQLPAIHIHGVLYIKGRLRITDRKMMFSTNDSLAMLLCGRLKPLEISYHRISEVIEDSDRNRIKVKTQSDYEYLFSVGAERDRIINLLQELCTTLPRGEPGAGVCLGTRPTGRSHEAVRGVQLPEGPGQFGHDHRRQGGTGAVEAWRKG